MKIIGLTGQTGAGKTTVSALFEKAGFHAINADTVAHAVMEPGQECLRQVEQAFGKEIIAPNGGLDRRKMAAIVFGDPAAMGKYTAICYPFICRAIEEEIAALRKSGAAFVLLDAPTLYESGADALCDAVVAVLADETHRLARILQRDGLTLEQAAARLGAQKDDAFYKNRTKYLLYNNGSEEDLEKSALALIAALQSAK